MKKIVALLLLLNFSSLLFVILSGIPTFMEFVWTYYVPTLIACLSCILFLVFKANKTIFKMLCLICLIGPGFLATNTLTSYLDDKRYQEEQNKFNTEITLVWRDQNCTTNSLAPNEEGFVDYKCKDGSTRFYLNDSLVRIEKPR